MSNSVENSILSLLTNPDIRSVAAPYIEDWQFSEDWRYKYIQCIKQPKYSGYVPDLDGFVIDLHNHYNVNEEECEYAAAILIGYTPPKSFDEAISNVQEWVRNSYISQGVEIIASGDNNHIKAKGIESIKTAVNLQFAVDSFHDFSDDESTAVLIKEDLPSADNLISSSFNIINKSLTYGAYKKSDLVAVAAASGVGKSTLLVTEGAHFTKLGHKVCHVVLGDLSESDVFLKYLSAYNNCETETILDNGYENYMGPSVKSYFKNLRVKSLLPDTYDVFQLLAKCEQLHKKWQYDVLIVDYDGNIRESSNAVNSYFGLGQTYAQLKAHAQMKNCLVYVASQTKVETWKLEMVPKTSLNDSSKKAMHLDVMVTLGKNEKCPNVGTLNLAKVRRGKSEVYTRIALENGKGLIKEISNNKYRDMMQAYELAQQGILEFDLEQAGM